MSLTLNYNDLSDSSTLTYKVFYSMHEQIDEAYEKYLKLNQLNMALTNRLQNKNMTLEQFYAVMAMAGYSQFDLSIEEIMSTVFERGE